MQRPNETSSDASERGWRFTTLERGVLCALSLLYSVSLIGWAVISWLVGASSGLVAFIGLYVFSMEPSAAKRWTNAEPAVTLATVCLVLGVALIVAAVVKSVAAVALVLRARWAALVLWLGAGVGMFFWLLVTVILAVVIDEGLLPLVIVPLIGVGWNGLVAAYFAVKAALSPAALRR